MRKRSGMALAGVLACVIGTAKADEEHGTIDKINPTTNTISVGDKIFAVSPNNTVGPALGELKVGDRVKVFYASGRVQKETKFNAMRIEKQPE
jgi:hypothetical protein